MSETMPSSEEPNHSSRPLPPDAERWVEEITEQFLDKLQAGTEPDRNALVAAYPEFADLLDKQLSFVEKLHSAARKQRANDARVISPDTPVLRGPNAETLSLFSKDAWGGDRAAEPVPERIGRYLVCELLGQGASGTVYRTYDPKLNRDVALKVFPSPRLAGADFAERFHREARIAAQLRHTNIVPVYETGVHEGQPFIVMEYVRGQTLAARLARGPIPFHEAAELVRKVADALDYAHGFGIIHRDVKPSNILLDARGEPQLIDFGLARHAGGHASMTELGQILGTPDYMSPEQARGDAHGADQRTDVYSLGAVLYRLLTGKVPLPALCLQEAPDCLASQVYHIVHTEPVCPRAVNATIPRDLETICLKALAKEPEERFVSAAALAEELRRWLKDEPLRVRPPMWWEMVWRWARRNRLTAASLASALLLLVAGSTLGSMAWLQYQRAAEAREAESREKSLRAEVEAGTLLFKARERVHTPTIGRRTQTLKLLCRLAESRRKIHDEQLGERLAIQARSVLAEALAMPDLVVAEQANLPEWPFAGWPASMHPGGRQMAVGTLDGPVLWQRGRQLPQPRTPQLGQRPPRLVYSPDGRYLAFAPAEGGVQLWNEEVTRVLAGRKPPETRVVLALGFAADGQTLSICCDDGQVQGLSLPDLRFSAEWHVAGSARRLTSASFNADATRLAVGDKQGAVSLYENGQLLRSLSPGRMEVEALAWSPDSRKVAVGSKDGIVQLRSAEGGLLLHNFVLGNVGVSEIQFSPDGRWLLAGRWSGYGHKVWDVETGEQLWTGGGAPGGFAGDGRCYAESSANSAAFCDLLIPQAIRRLSGHRAALARLAWSRDNRRLVSLDTRFEVRVWGVDRSTSLDAFLPPVGGFFAGNAAVALSDDGRQVAFASGEEKESHALIHELPTGKTLGEWAMPGGFERLACIGGNKFLLVREELDENKQNTHSVALELEVGRPASVPRLLRASRAGDHRRYLDCNLTPDGRYYWWLGPRLPKDAGRRIEVREVATGRLVFEKRALSSAAQPGAFLSSDARYLWLNTRETGNLRYDLADASRPPERFPDQIVAFSPASRWLVALAVADDLRPSPVWCLRRLEEDRTWLEIPTGDARPIDTASFSANGRYLALGHNSGHVTVVDVPALQQEIADFENTLPK